MPKAINVALASSTHIPATLRIFHKEIPDRSLPAVALRDGGFISFTCPEWRRESWVLVFGYNMNTNNLINKNLTT